MRKNKIYRIIIAATAFILMTISFYSIFSTNVYADDSNNNTIYIKDSKVEANESGLVIVELAGEGKANDEISVLYHTEGGTAIPDLDYVKINNSVKLKYDKDGKISYKISIKGLSTAENRSKFRLYDQDGNEYGRYFNLILDKAGKATIDTNRSSCKCYLSYNYKAEAVVGVMEDAAYVTEDHSYIKEYSNVRGKYDDGPGSLDGKDTWYSWKNGKHTTFADETSEFWLNAFVNTGIASVYGTFFIDFIGAGDVNSLTDISTLYGNKELIEKYTRSTSCPGLMIYMETEPGWRIFSDSAYRINDTAMKMILIDDDNPYSDHKKLVDVQEKTIKAETKLLYWIQKEKTWYAGANSLVGTGFMKVTPYNGVIDTGLAIHNGNKEVDNKIEDIWQLLTLVDNQTPEILGEYVDDSYVSETGKLRIYLRFSEPVKMARSNESLKVDFYNQQGTQVSSGWGEYVEGNYSDTLVFDVEPPKANISKMKYELPTDNIGDMAYNLDKYRIIRNNRFSTDVTDNARTLTSLNGAVNLLTPTLTIDLSSSSEAQNIYNLLLSINDNGQKDITDGSLYYTWDKNESLTINDQVLTPDELKNGDNYSNKHDFTPEENGSLTLTFVKSEKDKIDSGTYYLHVLAKSGYGLTDVDTFGPYVLDGDPPDVTQISPTINELKVKEYTLQLRNKSSNLAGIMNINIVYKYTDKEGIVKEQRVKLYENSAFIQELAQNNLVREETSDEGYTKFYYKSSIDTNDEEAKRDKVISQIMADNGLNRMTFDVNFVVEDTAGNRNISNSIKVFYDTRNLFKVDFEYSKAHDEYKGFTEIDDSDKGITVSYTALDISTIGENDDEKLIRIKISDDNKNLLSDGLTFSISINGGEPINADGTDGDAKYQVTLFNLGPGFYDIIPRISGTTTGNEGTNVDIVANDVQFYLTNGKKDKTANYETATGNLVLTNKVFQLQEQRFYYLDESSSTIISYPYGATYDVTTNKSEGGSIYPSFSNINEAKKYVKYMEYQDLHLVKISANIASLLNSGQASTAFVKASGETVTAQEGQLWIRYKRNIWSSNQSTSGWAFYYYGNGNVEDGININSLPTNLLNSINEVVNRITNGGKIVYLVEEETINQTTGAPYLASTQIHSNLEQADQTKTGVKYVSPVKYDGDSQIYKNTVKILENEYPIATNMPITVTSSTKLFYTYAESDKWYEINAVDGKRLSEVFGDKSSGYYVFREYGDNGICEFSVYYDKSLPILNVSIGNRDITLDGEILEYSSDTFTIKSLENEVDDLAYIAIYSYPNKSLQTVLYASDLKVENSDQTNYFKLENDNYYVQVGDRSGNIVMYTVLLSTSSLDVDISENETKSNVIVKVLNRTENEIYSYEVYLNETLVTAEFQERKVFQDPGIYRVTVVDIYGNEVTKTLEFAFKTPEINWYYMNGADTYSKYDPERIVNMVIYPDQNSSKISNVYTSAMLKLTFVTAYGDDPIKFEIMDLESGDYTYSDVSDTIVINKLAGFRIRTWFENYPQSDHTYIVKVDNEAPVISSSFIGVSYARYLEMEETEQGTKIIKTGSFDQIDFSKYNEGDYITLDTLAYVTSDNVQTSFGNNAVISGGHITIGFNDPSKIKDYTVTLNDDILEVELNEEEQLVMNNYGKFLIKVTDMLGNVGTLSFINTKDPISTATIDGENLVDSVQTYGHEAVIVKTLYQGETQILIKTSDKSNVYILNNDGSLITCGRYVCAIEKTEDDSGQVIDTKYINLVNESFSLDLKAENTRENVAYNIITDDDYIISVIINEGLASYKVECANKEIELEISYSAGGTVFPSYYITKLSKETPTIRLLTGGADVVIKEDSKYIYVANTLTIDPNIDENITNIMVGYSKTPTFGDLVLLYDGVGFTMNFEGNDEGFYKIVVTNKYNNSKEYLITKVDSFKSIVTVTYQDETSRMFLSNENVIYSNATISLSVYSNEVNFEVNDEVYDGLTESGVTTLELYKQGNYKVKVINPNGVFENFEFVIGTDGEFVFKDELDWLTGYNEQALLKDQGYTNTKLSVHIGENVEYIAYKVKEDELHVIYDNISEEKIIDEDLLNEAIGQDGAGDYTVYFKNKYGDSTSKVVHFNDNPGLILSRKTVAENTAFDNYPIEKAIESNFYSNYVLKFETKSLKYEFTIDGVNYSLEEPKLIEFSNSSGNGSFGYAVTYLDEYGNYVEFNAELNRSDVAIDKTQMKEIVLGNSVYTKDNIVITFADDLIGTVSFNDGEAKPYDSGTTFYKDGKYSFIVEDIAGNRNVYVINHKSVNHYTLTNSLTQQQVIIGSVINNASVVFSSSDDSRLVSVFKNGQQMIDYSTNSFTTSGHWEIIIEDSVGNTAYAGFYIVNNPLISFEYNSPFDYEITEVWYTNLNGQRQQMDVEDGTKIVLTKNGDYAVVVTAKGSNSTFNFSVTINDTPPTATLVGVEDGGVTARNVSLKGLKTGDVVEIYKDGALLNTIDVSLSNTIPEISTGGNYKIVIKAVSGAQIEYNFTRKQIANAAGSIFIIIACLASVAGLTIGLLYHTRLKNDSEK